MTWIANVTDDDWMLVRQLQKSLAATRSVGISDAAVYAAYKLHMEEIFSLPCFS